MVIFDYRRYADSCCHVVPDENQIMEEYLVSDLTDKRNHRQKIYKFPNGYGASVIQGPYTYGGPDGKWELAVLDKNEDLCYTTPITEDVVGHLNDPEVDNLLRQIKQL